MCSRSSFLFTLRPPPPRALRSLRRFSVTARGSSQQYLPPPQQKVNIKPVEESFLKSRSKFACWPTEKLSLWRDPVSAPQTAAFHKKPRTTSLTKPRRPPSGTSLSFFYCTFKHVTALSRPPALLGRAMLTAPPLSLPACCWLPTFFDVSALSLVRLCAHDLLTLSSFS